MRELPPALLRHLADVHAPSPEDGWIIVWNDAEQRWEASEGGGSSDRFESQEWVDADGKVWIVTMGTDGTFQISITAPSEGESVLWIAEVLALLDVPEPPNELGDSPSIIEHAQIIATEG